jgi:hypothetical protein
VAPASVVLKVRPSAVDTDAVRASLARTPDRSVISGNTTRRQLRPSVETSTTPPRPTTQQTNAEGAAPAVSSAEIPVDVASQLAPPLVERCTPEAAIRQRTIGSGETISIPTVSARGLAARAESNAFAADGDGAAAGRRQLSIQAICLGWRDIPAHLRFTLDAAPGLFLRGLVRNNGAHRSRCNVPTRG